MATRKQCKTEGCRKFVKLEEGFDLCRYCREQKENDPFAGLTKLTELQAEKWGRLDAEIRNALQGQRIKILEIELEDLKERERREVFKRQQDQKQIEKEMLVQQVVKLKNEYETLTTEIAEMYKLDKEKIVIDPDTGVIREIE